MIDIFVGIYYVIKILVKSCVTVLLQSCGFICSDRIDTCATEAMFLSAFVCLFVSRIMHKLLNQFTQKLIER